MSDPDSHKAAGGWAALRAGTAKIIESKGVTKSILALRRLNQPNGFDCPGCAWPDPKDTSIAEFCENGIKAVAAETTGKRVTPEFFARHTVSELLAKDDFWLEDQGRLTEPMQYDAASDTYRPVSWEDAFSRIGQTLKELDSPDEAIFYTSGRTSNEAAFLYQLFVRLFGTNNLPDCSNMCHESSGVALGESIGIGKGTVLLEDFEKADAIFIMGQNPGTNHPRMLTELQKARKRGAEIVTLNPIPEIGLQKFSHPQKVGQMLTGSASEITSEYLQPLIGGDLAALKGIMKCLVDREDAAPGSVLDHNFIKEHTAGFEDFLEDIRKVDWAEVQRESGLTREDIERVADIYARSERVIICWAMGLTQHKHAVPTIKQVINLLLLRGNIGKPGAGACPVRGHSNVQGDRTMGIWERPKPEFLDSLEAVFDFKPPREHGVDAVGAIHAMAEGKGKVFFAMGGNFARATPDSDFTEEALRNCDLTAHVTTKLNKSHLVHGRQAFILPCLGRTEIDRQKSGEQSVTVEDSMSMVHASHGRRSPASPKLLSEPAIIAGLAKATIGNTSSIDWDYLVADYSRIRDLVEKVVPGFKDFNKRIREPGGFYLGNTAARREWKTRGQRAAFTVSAIPKLDPGEGCFRLMTIRSHDQYNTTIYGKDDRYRGIKGERRVLFINASDMKALGFKESQRVDIISVYGDGRHRRAPDFRLVPYDIPAGCLAAYFPETNVLVSVDSIAERSRTPTSKFIPVRIEAR